MNRRVAMRYAKAILEIAIDRAILEDIVKDMYVVSETFSESKELMGFISNPRVERKNKLSTILEVFPSISGLTKELIEILVQNKRLELLNDIAHAFIELYGEHKGLQKVEFITAVPVTEAIQNKLLNKLKSITDKQIEFVNIVDKSIKGGFILKIDDKQFNSSIESKLKSLKRELAN